MHTRSTNNEIVLLQSSIMNVDDAQSHAVQVDFTRFAGSTNRVCENTNVKTFSTTTKVF